MGILLPLVAAVVVFGTTGLELIHEGGAWCWLVLALLLLTWATPALAALTNAPKPVMAGLSALPFLAGVLGVARGSWMVANVLQDVSPGDRIIIAAAGTAEVASIFIVASVIGGALLVGVGFAIAASVRGPGGGVLLAAGIVVIALGARWLPLRGVLQALNAVAASERAMILAASLGEIQMLSMIFIGVAVTALIAGIALGLTRPGAMGTGDTVGVVVAAVVVIVAGAFGEVTLSDGTAVGASSWRSTVVFAGARAAPPPAHIITAAGVQEQEHGQRLSFALDPGARGVDVRRALMAAGTVRVDLVGPSDMRLPAGFAVPRVVEQVFNQEARGVHVISHTDRALGSVPFIVTIGNVVATTGVPSLRYQEGVALPSETTPIGVVFADDVSAADLAAALVAITGDRREVDLIVSAAGVAP